MTETATIFALSSGHGRAGVAVIRISGPQAGPALDGMAAPRPKPRYAALRRVRHPASKEVLDEALVLWLPGPKSETGEDIAELQVHGSAAVIRAVLDALGTMPGCRLAEPGEFARCAFDNGRLDLTAAEGLADLIDAETEAQRRQALAQAGGALARLYDGWRDGLLEARALTEAAIDFSDEGDVAADALSKAATRASALRDEIRAHLADGHRGEIIRDGFRVVIAGRPNAGKSSLLNGLARRDVAIVSDEPGTTRDVVEVRLDLGGYSVVLTDTAGVRETTGRVEQEGIRRTLARARDADLVLWLIDATAPDPIIPTEISTGCAPVVTIYSKVDAAPGHLHDRSPASALQVSSHSGYGLTDLTATLANEVKTRLGAASRPPPSQQRHRLGLESCLSALDRYLASASHAPELGAEDLRQAADALGRIVGHIDPEEVLGAIFGRFCIGK
ncbi:MAG: tRNA uridine-5-carboxymethylaminomethyl(34) synthesis GTPase MnmE [Hyphomicrobiaceae bacterium]